MTQATLTLTLPTANVVNTTNDQSSTNVSSKIQEWCGRGASAIGNGVSSAGNAIIHVFQQSLNGLHLITSDTSATAGVFRKLDHHVLKFFEHLSDSKGSLIRFGTFLKRNVAFIDFVQLASEINYFAGCKFKERKNAQGEVVKQRDNNVVISGRAAFLTANTGGALLWLEEMSFFSLSQIGKAIGEARVFSFVPKVISSIPVLRDLPGLQNVAKTIGEFRAFSFVKHFSCLSITLRALDLGYALFAIDSSRRLFNASNKIQTISAGIDLSSYLAELTLSALVFAGVTNIIGLGVAGATCITLAAASFLYRVTHEKEMKHLPQLPALVG